MTFLSAPFKALVGHFVRRLFASEAEQGTGGLGLGLGAVLAILASPGAFASIFLLGKYSTLLQWFRGEQIDAIRRSPSDEYFFVVLSMTITGLVTVARWNRLFPDRRDFENLAVLPIAIRSIFFANFSALLGLAVLFALDVNAVSALFFPFFVTISIGSFAAFLKVGVAHAVTVFASSLFSFFFVFALVGLLMLVIPRRVSRRVSLVARILLVIGLLTEFFSNILVQLFAGRLPGGPASSMRFVPSFWFLGIYESMLGIARPQMALLAREAWIALCAAVVISVVSYALCYRRIFIRLPESFDITGSSRLFFRMGFPESMLRPCFLSQFERASICFSLKVLLRSEKHLLFVGAYLGIGLVIVAQTALDSPGNSHFGGLPDAGYFAIPFLIAFVIMSGLRFVFDTPAVLPANWVFQVAAGRPDPLPRQIARRLMLSATLPWQVSLLAPLAVKRLGWPLALLHISTIVTFTILFAEALLLRFQKIPFTCSTELDIKQALAKLLAAVFGVLAFVPALASLELWMLESPARFACDF